MNEIKCPKCGTVFQISETDYESIVKQIRDKEFDKEISFRENEFKKDKENAIKLRETELENNLTKELNKKDSEINDLKNTFRDELNKRNWIIKDLENKIEKLDTENKLAIKNATSEKDKEINSLQLQLETDKRIYTEKEQDLKNSYEDKIKDKEEQIAYYKDFKARQSTKMIWESLEQHCNTEFNKLRPLFKNCYFDKDNDAKSWSKWDFIFRDFDDDWTEIVSIMFEMKNEADETSTKHKNEDFLKELDKDRKEKKCEYAVLVSLLETDNELYNEWIVDMSHKYEKMYVIRPQFFIPIITLIRWLAANSLEYKKELQFIQNQNIDISHFEEDVNNFKENFWRNYRLASERFAKAIEEIDKTIDHLQKTKENLLASENNLRIANNKAEDLSIKKLTRSNPTMEKMFEDLKNEKLLWEWR